MTKEALESLLKAYNGKMGWATIAVAAGILGEYIAHFVFSKEKKGLAEWLSTVLFAILVVAGVGGEYWYGKQLSAAADELQGISDKEVEDAKTRAKGFESEIAAANARAKSAEAQIASASAASREAVAKVASAELRIAEAKARAAEALQAAEQEHLARVKIEERMSDRVLTPEVFVKIFNAIKSKPIKSKVMMLPLIGYPEAGRYAEQFSRVLSAAGVNLGWSIMDRSTLYGV